MFTPWGLLHVGGVVDLLPFSLRPVIAECSPGQPTARCTETLAFRLMMVWNGKTLHGHWGRVPPGSDHEPAAQLLAPWRPTAICSGARWRPRGSRSLVPPRACFTANRFRTSGRAATVVFRRRILAAGWTWDLLVAGASPRRRRVLGALPPACFLRLRLHLLASSGFLLPRTSLTASSGASQSSPRERLDSCRFTKLRSS